MNDADACSASELTGRRRECSRRCVQCSRNAREFARNPLKSSFSRRTHPVATETVRTWSRAPGSSLLRRVAACDLLGDEVLEERRILQWSVIFFHQLTFFHRHVCHLCDSEKSLVTTVLSKLLTSLQEYAKRALTALQFRCWSVPVSNRSFSCFSSTPF